jgi:transcriptional regulator with XRE-family HTH domain
MDRECKKLAKRMLKLMSEQGISQAELARRSGQTPMQVSRVVTAQQMPSALSLFEMAKVLDCEISELLG